MTLTEQRVREILLYAQHPTGRGLQHMMPEDAEIAALCQAVLDLADDVRTLREGVVSTLRMANLAEHERQSAIQGRAGASLLRPPTRHEVPSPCLEPRSTKEGG